MRRRRLKLCVLPKIPKSPLKRDDEKNMTVRSLLRIRRWIQDSSVEALRTKQAMIDLKSESEGIDR